METTPSPDAATGDAAEVTPAENWHEPCPVNEREQRMIQVGDISLNVACRGAGPTVVFLHGFPEFHYSWNKVMDELAGEFRLIAPDQRGYNISDKPEALDAYKLPLLVQDILQLLPKVSPEPVILVAHDWGGPVGWMVAHHPDAHLRGFIATNGPHPLRFADLIKNDPAQKAASSYMAFFRTPGSEAFFTEAFLVGQFEGVLTEEEVEVYKVAWAQPGAITGGLNWYRANNLDPADMEAVMEGFSETVTVPAVVMWGLDDEAVLAQNAEGLEVYAPDLVVETFPGVDHWIEHRIPEEIARVIRDLHKRLEHEATN
jgi:pimeloyl-ACP methyl ester carboxylesterase